MVSEDWWPCDKRVAHGPHPVWVRDTVSPDPKAMRVERDCQGVKAHPDTMIGRTKVAGA